jgi:predicted transposase YbfD/YdcC
MIHKTSLHAFFSDFPDSRVARHKQHYIDDIIILSIIAILCGASSWDSIAEFGRDKETFLRKILRLDNGIPSHDTINRVISTIRPQHFETRFAAWVESIRNKDVKKEVIAIDGKTARGSKDTFHNQRPIHLVSAWACENSLVLGQVKVDSKSNEITAIPILLDLLDIEGQIITVDAMGTQTAIAEKIVKGKGDYILALKANQKELLSQVEASFKRDIIESEIVETEKNRGRIETRQCQVIQDLTFIDNRDQWLGVQSIVKITSKRVIGEKEENEIRYYISSLKSQAGDFNGYIRAHWSVENSLHWCLDMTFGEDGCRKRHNNAAANFACIQKIALNIIKQDKSKGSMVTKRLKAGWNETFLLNLIKNYMR